MSPASPQSRIELGCCWGWRTVTAAWSCHDLLGEDAHLLVFGDARSGKTTVLRGLIAQLRGPAGSDVDRSIELAVVDYRRSLSPADAAGATVATNPPQAAALCASVVAELAHRLAEPDAVESVDGRVCDHASSGPASSNHPPGDLRARRAPDIYLLVDDYHLVTTGVGNPLNPLMAYLPHARDLGFHLVLARHTGGAARTQYEPLLQSLGDLGTPMLLLSGSPAEGRLAHGLVPQVLPPGRARLATRGSVPQLIQTPWTPRL